ncbi:hypothetical protein [Thermococcus litoralis]|uniref:hypothetical protein n=1 Tax=Thermococcus litoralis TaxID=2265 RepID=UPI000B358200|nr:hypothetical protein [Thermococcus litoralis]
MGAPTFGHGFARGVGDVIVPYILLVVLSTTGEAMKQLEPSMANMIGLIMLMFIFVGFVDLLDTVGRSKWWNVEYTGGYIIGVLFGFYILKTIGVPPDLMMIIGIMLIAVRLVGKIGRKL